MQTKCIFLIVFHFVTLQIAQAYEWTHWRGPHYDGTVDVEAGSFPVGWKDKDIVWKTALPGMAGGTPVVKNGKIFVITTAGNHTEVRAICIDQKSGQVLFDKKIDSARKFPLEGHCASPSPVVDEERVYFMTGKARFVALDHQGDLIWERDLVAELGPFDHHFGYSSTPYLEDGKLFVMALRGFKIKTVDSLLLALDAKTGKTVWQVKRESEALHESPLSFSSPLPTELDGQKIMMVWGADYITAHSHTDGQELWRYGYMGDNPRMRNWRQVATPVIGDGILFHPLPRGKTMHALKLNADKYEKIWEYTGDVPDVCNPTYKDGLIYFLHGAERTMTCLEGKTGKHIWTKQLDGGEIYRASPVLVDGKLICLSVDGQVNILKAGKKPELLTAFNIGQTGCLATPVIVDHHIYIRSTENLLSIKPSGSL
ncbi:MAG: PQQ-binding-like beta-propeller repeat protein [Verrucomicrobiota bacterium]